MPELQLLEMSQVESHSIVIEDVLATSNDGDLARERERVVEWVKLLGEK